MEISGHFSASSRGDFSSLRLRFLKWQCRIRQMAMRGRGGRPDAGMTPAVYLSDGSELIGHVVTVLNRRLEHSVTAELVHIASRTHDPAQRREQAVDFFSAGYFQHPLWFSDTLTAVFSSGFGKRLCGIGQVRLVFDSHSQVFDLGCVVREFVSGDPFYETTLAHNVLFNPALGPEVMVLGFVPDWSCVSAVRPDQAGDASGRG